MASFVGMYYEYSKCTSWFMKGNFEWFPKGGGISTKIGL